MSVVSACTQLCRIVREVAFSTFSSQYRDKAQMCLNTVEKASKQMTDTLDPHRNQESSPPSSEDESPRTNLHVWHIFDTYLFKIILINVIPFHIDYIL